MATKLIAWKEQRPVNLPGELQGDEGTTINSPLQDRKAPRVMPEEDIDASEPRAEVRAPQENQTSWIIQTVDVTQTENQKCSDINQYTLRETREMVTELEEISKEFSEASFIEEEPKATSDLSEDGSPPSPTASAFSGGENIEKGSFSSLEGEMSEWINHTEVISDPTEDFNHFDRQNCQKWLKTSQHTEQVYQEANKLPADKSVDAAGTSYIVTTSQPVQHSPSDIDNSHDVNAVNSPPYVDESEEEEEEVERKPQQERNTLDLSSKVFQPLGSAATVTDSVLHVGQPVRQREELLPQSHCESTPREVNQEAARGVFDQGSPPLSAVAMELSNQGGEASLGCGCIAAVKERYSRVWERTEGQKEQTGGKERHKGSRFGTNKPTRKSGGDGILKYLPTVQTPDLKTEKPTCGETKMRNDMYDSQSCGGVSADLLFTLEDPATSTGSPATETPIEREIRRAIQREQSLRRSRGLSNPPHSSPEYVEIPLRKSLLCQTLTSKWSQNKDREFAGKKMLHEIHEETQREQDLVKIGKIPGFYDKGTVRQIKERKQLFEAFQTPRDSTFFNPSKNKSLSLSSESTEDLSLEVQEIEQPQDYTVRYSHEERKPTLLNPIQTSKPAKGAAHDSTLQGLTEGAAFQIILLENSLTPPAQKQNPLKADVVSAVKSANPQNPSYHRRQYDGLMYTKQEEIESKENPFFKLRSSTDLVKVKQDILEAKERETELRKMRVSLYGGINGVVSSSHKEQTSGIPESSVKSKRGSSAVRQSVSKFSAWPPVQPEEEKVIWQEVVKSPRTPRQKTPLVQLWESGLVNGHNEGDD